MSDGDMRVGINLRMDRFMMSMTGMIQATHFVETAGLEGKRMAMDTGASPAS